MTSVTQKDFGFGIVFAGLLAALVLAGASFIPRHPPEEKQRLPSPEDLDRLAKPYFDRAAANVPAAAQELSRAGNLAFLAYLMVWRPESVQPRIWKRCWTGPSFSPAGPVRGSTASISIRRRF